MLRPVDAGGYQCNRAGVHHMNDTTKTPCESFAPISCSKSRRNLLQEFEHRPKQPFSQCSIAALIGVRKIVAAWSSRPPRSRKLTPLSSQLRHESLPTNN